MLTSNLARKYGDPGVFEQEIRAFEEMDSRQVPPAGAIVCVGSSSMKGWHPTIVEDLAPLTIIPRGFGGSNMNDALHYADRIVTVYKPRAVLLYEGDNDLAQGIAPEKLLAALRAFVRKVRAKLPQARIYVMSIKPSPSRWSMWPLVQSANRLIEQECSKDRCLVSVDVAGAMLDADGKLRQNIFQPDDLHMTRAGYEIWRDAVRPMLVERELQFETQA